MPFKKLRMNSSLHIYYRTYSYLALRLFWKRVTKQCYLCQLIVLHVDCEHIGLSFLIKSGKKISEKNHVIKHYLET